MAIIKEYKTMDGYITDDKQKRLNEWLSQDEYYKKIAREAMKSYFYYVKSYIEHYYQNNKSKEEIITDSKFGCQEDKRIIVSDGLSGGFLLNDDILLDDFFRSEYLIDDCKYLGNVFHEKYLDRHQKSERIIDILEKVRNNNPFYNINLIRLNEDDNKKRKKAHLKTIVSVYNVHGESCDFYQQVFDAFKLLGNDAKILVSPSKNKPMLYGESNKGKGLVLGIRYENKK